MSILFDCDLQDEAPCMPAANGLCKTHATCELVSGDFTLNSGAKSKWKIECDAFTDADWQGLAQLIAESTAPFHEVVGVPRGGLKLAAALLP